MLVGVIQGFIFAFVVFTSKKYKSLSNLYLAALILTFSYNLFQYYILSSKILSEVNFVIYVFIPVVPLFAVFVYFYVHALLFPEKKITKKMKWLYLPFFFFLISSILIKILLLISPDLEIRPLLKLHYGVNFLHELFSLFFAAVMCFLAYRLTIKYEKSQINIRPKMQIQWLKFMIFLPLLSNVLMWIYGIFCSVYKITPNYYPLWIFLSLMIYSLGHIGIYKYGINEEREKIREFSTKFEVKIKIPGPQNKNIELLEKYILHDKNYLDSNLTLEKTAENLSLNKSYLSRLINSELEVSFTDYVNKFRVEEAKNYLENQEFSNYTLVAVGLEAGFNSKSAFNNSFKKFTGMTPSEYKKSLAKKKSATESSTTEITS